MSRKDISDEEVCRAFDESWNTGQWPYMVLKRMTGEPEKVCYRAMERAHYRGLIQYGVSLRSGWLTEAGKKLLQQP